MTLTVITADDAGAPEQVYGVIQNISEMKIQEAEYYSSRRMLSGIIEAIY